MELLLEMQKRTPDARPAPDANAATPSSAGRALPAAALAATGLPPGIAAPLPGAAAGQQQAAPVLFGTREEPAIRSSAGQATPWRAGTGPQTSSAPGPQRPYRADSELHRWARWPAEFIGWLRENRYAVVAGAVVTLVLVWLVGAVVSRRRYAQ